jgi:methylglutamate dehydrogenase subunit B
MRINCPYCGERSLDEFVYQGDATLTRPDPASANAGNEFYSYGYERKNPAGAHQELWYHSAGCHAWLVVSRDTRTHEIAAITYAKKVAGARAKPSTGGA